MRLRKQPICRINRNIHNIQLSKAKRIISTLSTTTATIAKNHFILNIEQGKTQRSNWNFSHFQSGKLYLWRRMKGKPAFHFIKIFFLVLYLLFSTLPKHNNSHLHPKKIKTTTKNQLYRVKSTEKKRKKNDFNFRKIFISQMMWIHFSGHFSTRLNMRLNMMNNNGEWTIYLLNHVVQMSKWTENRIVIINNFLSQ